MAPHQQVPYEAGPQVGQRISLGGPLYPRVCFKKRKNRVESEIAFGVLLELRKRAQWKARVLVTTPR